MIPPSLSILAGDAAIFAHHCFKNRREMLIAVLRLSADAVEDMRLPLDRDFSGAGAIRYAEIAPSQNLSDTAFNLFAQQWKM